MIGHANAHANAHVLALALVIVHVVVRAQAYVHRTVLEAWPAVAARPGARHNGRCAVKRLSKPAGPQQQAA
eukprot:scaffold16855_cov62-Phaeocystis_antarctica.AAC.1